jgi:hypothetical protein
MSSLGEHVDDYLRFRRALGFKLERHGRILPQLVVYLEAAGASTVSSDMAISWARLPASAHPRHWAARLAVARGFAAYLQTIDEAVRSSVLEAGVTVGMSVGDSVSEWILSARRALVQPSTDLHFVSARWMASQISLMAACSSGR